tara:strand:- start:384 stop:1472 length:1089 start_codon:yes stop_codon:yes gene_type:complete
MGVKWSWAFGPETTLELVEMGWTFGSVGNEHVNYPVTTPVYTYPGSPTRYSYSVANAWSYRLTAPPKVLNNKGCVSVPFYWDNTFSEWYDYFSAIKINLPGVENIAVFPNNAGTNTLRMVLGGTEGVDATIPLNQWNYISITYDMSSTTWGAAWYVNGTLIQSGTKTGMTAVPDASSDQLQLSFSPGFCINNGSYMGQIIVYDDVADAAEVPWKFVSRIEPVEDAPAVTTGIWTPSSGLSNFAVLDLPWSTGSYTTNTGSADGDKVTVLLTGSGTPGMGGIPSQIGIVPTNISGITVHGWASGSGQDGFVGLASDINTFNMITGAHGQPSIGVPTYCFSTATGSAIGSWEASSSVYMKYEVT